MVTWIWDVGALALPEVSGLYNAAAPKPRVHLWSLPVPARFVLLCFRLSDVETCPRGRWWLQVGALARCADP